MGSAHPLNAPYQAFATADGWITVGAANQANWLRLLGVIGAEELAKDPRFADNAGRMAHLDTLSELLAQRFTADTSETWLSRLEAAGVPAGPVLSVGQMHDDAQARARDMVTTVEHERLGPVETLGLPIKLSETPGRVARGAPTYGQDTRAVLAEAGYDSAEIDRLIADGAVAAVDG